MMRDMVERFVASGEKAMAIPCASEKSAMRKQDDFFKLPKNDRRGTIVHRRGKVVFVINAVALGVQDGDV